MSDDFYLYCSCRPVWSYTEAKGQLCFFEIEQTGITVSLLLFATLPGSDLGVLWPL